MKLTRTTIYVLVIVVITVIVLLLVTRNFTRESYSNLTGDQVVHIDHSVYGKLIMFNNDVITDFIKEGDIWEESIVKKMSDYYINGTDVLDVGCHSGLSMLGMHHFKPINGQVHCIEPQSAQCEIIKHNLDGKLDYRLYNLALMDTTQPICFETERGNTGRTPMINEETRTCVAAVPLDMLLPYFKRRISVMKIDVEGQEYSVLQGSRQFLANHKPVIEIEIFEQSFDKVNNLLNQLHYKLNEKLNDYDYLYVPL
jgi:FkbM family methyltransferase